jgi:hypothetical protein
VVLLFYTMHIHNQLGEKLSDGKVIESHMPLLGLKQIERLDSLSNGLKLHESDDQGKFLARVGKVMTGMSVDHMLEYLVNNRDIPVGKVISAVRLSPDCNTARRIHWGAEQLKRHKVRSGRPAAAQVSQEMAGSHA